MTAGGWFTGHAGI